MAPSFPKLSLLWGMSYDELSELEDMIRETLYLARTYPELYSDGEIDRQRWEQFHLRCETFCDKYHGKLAFENDIRYGREPKPVVTGLLASINDFIAKRFKKEIDTVFGHPVVLVIHKPEPSITETRVFRLRSGAIKADFEKTLHNAVDYYKAKSGRKRDLNYEYIGKIPDDILSNFGIVDASEEIEVIDVDCMDAI